MKSINRQRATKGEEFLEKLSLRKALPVLSQSYHKINWTFALVFLFLALCTFNALADNKKGNPGAQNKSYIACLGRIVPRGGTYYIAATAGQIIKEVFIKPGDLIKKGEKLVTLLGYDEAIAGIKVAKENLCIAKENLKKVKAGADKELIDANKAAVSKLKLVAEDARGDYKRAENLYSKNIISKEKMQNAKLAYFSSQADLLMADSKLKHIQRVPKIDVSLAQTRVKLAEAEYEKAQAALHSVIITSPIDGKVLDIFSSAGEATKPSGILAVGRTDVYFVEAQVYVSDIKHVKPGDEAIITSDFFHGTLHGKVTEIFRVLGFKSIFKPNPISFSDDRVIKVMIQLSSTEIPSKYINTEVLVKIEK